MDEEQLLQSAQGLSSNVGPPVEPVSEPPTVEEAQATADSQTKEDIKEEEEGRLGGPGSGNWNPFTKEFWVGGEAGDFGWTSEPQGIRDVEVGSKLDPIAKDPKSALEYYLAPGAGALDTGIGLVNLATPGNLDIPQLPKFENQGAQLARDAASLLIPGLGASKGINALGTAARGLRGGGLAGRAGAFSRDPLVRVLATRSAQIGAGGLIDYAAPMQSEGDTFLGSIYSLSPQHMGWISEDLRVVEGDGPDDIRRKNVQEGFGFAGLGIALKGMVRLKNALSGMDNATQYVPKNEMAGEYFARNQPTNISDAAEFADDLAFRAEVDLDELGNYNYAKESYGAVDPDDIIAFGKDKELYSWAESGIRTTDDMGIIGAQVDLGRIATNTDTVYGRIRNPVSEAALKYSLDTPGGVSRILAGLGDQLRLSGDYDYITNTGKLVDSKVMKDAADELAAKMLDMPLKDMKSLLKEYTVMREGLPQLTKEGGKAVKKAMNRGLLTLADPATLRATALLESSFSGQVADLAQGMRWYDGSESYLRAQDQLLDKLEFLQTLRGTTAYSKNKLVRTKSFWNKITGAENLSSAEKYSRRITEQLTGEFDETLEALELIQRDSAEMMKTYRTIAEERPLWLKPMAKLYELTDGDARSMTYLNNYLKQSTGVMRKAFIDGQPEIPSVIMQGFWSQAFNSALLGLKTPPKAIVSNLSTWALKPATHVTGAFLQGNKAELSRAMFAYGGVMETMRDSLDYAKRMFVRSAQEPDILRSRDEMVYKTDDQMGLFKSVADAEEAMGNSGPAALYEIMQNQKDLAEHPWLRFGNRAMGFGDAWLKATNASFVSKLEAWDVITKNGTVEMTKPYTLDQLRKKIYNDMFDESGVIRNQQVDTMSAKATFSQDNALSKGFQELMQRIPGLKPFFMFTRSPVNSLTFGASFQPVGAFIDKTKKFSKPFEDMPREVVERLLKEEGVPVNQGNIYGEYTRLRNEYKGRSAVGVSLVMLGVYGYLSGNITGRAGLADTKKQAGRREAGWKPMTAWGVDYSQIPAVSDWVALTVDIMDNADSLQQWETGEALRTLAYIIGANITDRTQMQNIEQFNDVLKGDPAAIQRWAAYTTFNSSTLVGGFLGTMNSVMAPQLKAVENHYMSVLRNRLPGKGGLPDKHDWIDGGVVNDIDNPLQRLYNALSPLPYHSAPSKVKQYLIDVEYNTDLGMTSRSDGAPYTKAELNQIAEIMGRDGDFRKEVAQIMKKYPADKFRSDYNEARGKGLNPDLGSFDNLHALLDDAKDRAKAKAEAQLPKLLEKKRMEALKNKGPQAYLRQGDIEGAQRFVESMQQISH